MARFASRFAVYKHGARNGREMVLADGQRQTLVRELFIEFDQNTLNNEERQFAVDNMVHKGLPIDRDTEEHYSAWSRISGFDSHDAAARLDWSDEEREIVEQALRNSIHYGSDHIELIPVPAALPWATYESIESVEELVSIAKAIGAVESAIKYELENRNRPEVLAALRDEPVEEDEVVLDAS